mmetsp:Transcript_17806/g.17030  ORF Transcript_17806/g.17030 Transcript_17806/m.17030 type:complete len:127 (+) Transcript_17806:990-1370(+)
MEREQEYRQKYMAPGKFKRTTQTFSEDPKRKINLTNYEDLNHHAIEDIKNEILNETFATRQTPIVRETNIYLLAGASNLPKIAKGSIYLKNPKAYQDMQKQFMNKSFLGGAGPRYFSTQSQSITES